MPDHHAATDAAAAADLRFSSQLAEPEHLWIAYAPRGWAGPAGPWLDLAAGRLGRGSRQAAPLRTAARFDDLVYLPPVPAGRAAERDALAAQLLAAGTPVLVQLLAGGEDLGIPAASGMTAEGGGTAESGVAVGRGAGLDMSGAVFVVDLLPALLAGELGVLERVPAWAMAVWPLLAGITDELALWQEGCRRLAAAGVRCVQAVAPVLGPGDRRLLAAGRDEQAFEGLFHRQAPAERDFARVAHRHGMTPLVARPLPRPPLLRAENRRVAGLLAYAGDLWLRVGRPVEQAQSLFRAARFWDATTHDVGALVRDGNLAVLTALDPLARELSAAAASGDDRQGTPIESRSWVPPLPRLVAELLAEYLTEASDAASDGVAPPSNAAGSVPAVAYPNVQTGDPANLAGSSDAAGSDEPGEGGASSFGGSDGSAAGDDDQPAGAAGGPDGAGGVPADADGVRATAGASDSGRNERSPG